MSWRADDRNDAITGRGQYRTMTEEAFKLAYPEDVEDTTEWSVIW